MLSGIHGGSIFEEQVQGHYGARRVPEGRRELRGENVMNKQDQHTQNALW